MGGVYKDALTPGTRTRLDADRKFLDHAAWILLDLKVEEAGAAAHRRRHPVLSPKVRRGISGLNRSSALCQNCVRQP